MDYLYRYMQCNTPYSRAIFHEQSQESFQKAFYLKIWLAVQIGYLLLSPEERVQQEISSLE